MSNKDKALEIASSAKQTAGQLASNLKQSEAYSQTGDALGKAKAAVAEVDYSGVKLMNLFSVFVYAFLIFSTYLPVAEFLGTSVSISDFAPGWLYFLAIAGLVSHLLGAKQLLSRFLTFSLLASISLKIISGVQDVMQVSSYGSRNTYSLPLDLLGFGFYVFLASLLLLLVVLCKPGYRNNREMWAKIIKK